MEYNLELEEHKQCWLMKYNCPCRTGACYSSLPDDGCPVYRWFKELIKYQENKNKEIVI